MTASGIFALTVCILAAQAVILGLVVLAICRIIQAQLRGKR